MKAFKATLQTGLILLSLAFLPEHSHGQVYLTGVLQDGTTPNGDTAGSPIWNTLGNELSFANLYITQPNAGYAAPFLNSGNGAGTSISYALAPGTYQFYFFCDALADNNPGYYGLSLFFDGNNNTSPGISAYSAAGVSSANAVPAGLGTLPLSGNTSNPAPAPGTYIYTTTSVPAPGSLTCTADGLSVTLTAYGFGMPGAFGLPLLDRVTNLNDAPDGYADGVGFFSLTVSAVPEPSFSVIFVAAVSFFLVFKVKRAHKLALRGAAKRAREHDSCQPIESHEARGSMKANWLVWVLLIILSGCASTPEQRTANEQSREAERKTEQERRQAKETKKQQEEQDRIIQKYASFTTEQLRFKFVGLDQAIARGKAGTEILLQQGNGIGVLIAQGEVEGKVKERDAVGLEIIRREHAQGRAPETAKPGASGSGNDIVNSNPSASGTGFFITDDGCLISNYHVVKDAAKIRLLTSTGLIDAKVVQVDAANDLALLKAEGKFSSLPIMASRTVHLGGSVVTVGFPEIDSQGFAPKLAKGEIASLSGIHDDPRYFQISVPVQHGNSGGALVDEHGNVVGVVSAKLGMAIGQASTSDELPENVNYAVKSSFLLGFLESVPDVSAKLKEPNTQEEKFEDVVKSAQDAAVLVLVY